MTDGSQPRKMQHSTISVGATDTLVLAENQRRTYCLIQNDSDTTVYIKMGGGAAVVGQGIRLVPNGGSFEMSPRNANLDMTEIRGIHGAAGSKSLLLTYA